MDEGKTRDALIAELEATRQRVTELELVAQKLAQSEQRAAAREAMFRAFPDLSFRIARDGTILDYHVGRASQLFVPPEAFLGKRVQDVLPGDAAREHLECVERALAGEVVTLVYALPFPEGERVFEARFVALDDEVYDVVREITDRVRAERERRELEAHIQHTQKLESLGLLAGGIAHDFNNMLCAILGLTGLSLRALPEDAPLAANLREIDSISRKCADLAHQMLAYAGKGRFVIENVDFTALVADMRELLRSSVSKRAELSFELADDLPLIRADVTQMRQLLMNFVVNASEAIAEEDGSIVVRARRVDDARELSWWPSGPPPGSCPYLVLEVSDTGCGMDDATRARIFEPFFSTKFTGRGLGLAAVFGIVHGHDGVLAVESAVDRGTTFRVALPALDAASVATPHTPTEVDSWTGAGTVLLVDDEEVVRSTVTTMLEALGFDVITAANGEEALERLREHQRIACVILDCTMPKMDGPETLTRLRELGIEIPVLLSSGYGAVETKIPEHGPSGFLQKPFGLEEVRQKLRSLLSE